MIEEKIEPGNFSLPAESAPYEDALVINCSCGHELRAASVEEALRTSLCFCTRCTRELMDIRNTDPERAISAVVGRVVEADRLGLVKDDVEASAALWQQVTRNLLRVRSWLRDPRMALYPSYDREVRENVAALAKEVLRLVQGKG